jgi:FkbM family methyltransferase
MLGGIVDRIFGALGYRVLREELLRELQGTLGWDRLRSLPIRPSTIIDVGVADGTPELYSAFPEAFLILVEPVQEFFPGINHLLAQRRGLHLPFALGERPGEMTMNVEPDGAKSSLLRRTSLTRTGDPVIERRIPVRTLDDAIHDISFNGPTLLKIDVEGFELNVLRGATQALLKIDLLLIEASVAQRFEGGAQLADLISFLAAHQFVLRDIVHIARDPRVGVRHADLVFTRPTLAAPERPL